MKIKLQKSVLSYLNFISILTIFNILCGCISIYLAINGSYIWAGALLLFSVAFDTLDGFLACRLSLETDFGAEFDSLADLVAFGVAPMVLVVTYFDSLLLSIISMLIPLLGALRLARHNVTHKFFKDSLIGLPIGASGVVIPILVFADVDQLVAGMVIAVIGCLYLGTFTFTKFTHAK